MTQPSQHTLCNRQGGFTVVEFIVILSIFAVMASVALFNFRDFSGTTDLSNLAFDIALEVKRAQTIGSSSIDDTSGAQSAVTVFFPYDSDTSSFNSTFEVYREFGLTTPQGVLGRFDANAGDLVDRVSQINDASVVSMEDTASGDAIAYDVAIAFMRPRTEPVILSRGCDGPAHLLSAGTAQCREGVSIVVESDGRQKTIMIEPTGNIYVQ